MPNHSTNQNIDSFTLHPTTAIWSAFAKQVLCPICGIPYLHLSGLNALKKFLSVLDEKSGEKLCTHEKNLEDAVKEVLNSTGSQK